MLYHVRWALRPRYVRYAVVGQKDLPLSGNHIGDARYVADDKHWYVWLIQSANSAPAWIDP
jgi:hypothetical protein